MIAIRKRFDLVLLKESAISELPKPHLPAFRIAADEALSDSSPRLRSQTSSHGEASAPAQTPRNGNDAGALLARIRAGDQSAVAELYDRYAAVVFSAAQRVLRDAGSAEDVLQEVFLQLWRNPQIFDSGRGSLAAWLAVIARNRAIDQRRRQRPVSDLEECALLTDAHLDDEMERSEAIGRVRTVLLNLPAEQRCALEKAFFEGMTHAEIAEQTGEPLGTIKTRIRSALIAIRRVLGSESRS